MTFLLDIIYLVVGVPVVLWNVATRPRFRSGWRERLGAAPDLPARPRLWVHCVSVGEVLLARTLAARLRNEYPDADLVISTSTATGRETAAKLFADLTVFYFPFDLSAAVRRAFRRIRPSAVVLVELEVWPNFVTVADRLGVPVVVVNGRITERSARRYRRFGGLTRRVFTRVTHFAVQNDEYAERLASLGVPRGCISVTGTMKYDAVATDVPPAVVERHRKLLRLNEGDTVVVGGCTHPGEDEALIAWYAERRAESPGLRLVLAPRHVERADAVEAAVCDAGLLCVRKTALDAGAAPDDFDRAPHVILADTTGELADLYAVATVVFVGGSLVEHGGHNMIEPAALGKAVCFGPHTGNFRETAALLIENDAAVEVTDAAGLAGVLDALCGDPARRRELGGRARSLVEQARGAADRNMGAIRPHLSIMAARNAT